MYYIVPVADYFTVTHFKTFLGSFGSGCAGGGGFGSAGWPWAEPNCVAASKGVRPAVFLSYSGSAHRWSDGLGSVGRFGKCCANSYSTIASSYLWAWRWSGGGWHARTSSSPSPHPKSPSDNSPHHASSKIRCCLDDTRTAHPTRPQSLCWKSYYVCSCFVEF